jgi:hypothetical protein
MARAKTHPSLVEALQLLRKARRSPTETDIPPPRPLPGHKPKVLNGQLDIYGRVHGDDERE